MVKKVKEEEKDSFKPVNKIETKKDIPVIKKPSLSAYKEPELMPMREKEVLSRKDQKAKALIVNSAKRYDAPLDMGYNPTYNLGRVINPSRPQTEIKTDNIAKSARNLQSDDPAISAKGFTELKGKAPQQEAPKLDSKQLMDDARLQRKLRWADALVAFGDGYRGNYSDENSATTKLQRKRDEQFQEYKDIINNNQKVEQVWDAQTRDELIKFLETQKKNRELTAREEAKLDEARFIKERDYALKAATEAEKIKSGYYNKRTSSQKANPKANLPFESEAIINEMNEISGGGAGVASRNQKRLEELIASNPDGYKTMLGLADNSSKLRKQRAEKKKAYTDAIKEGNSVTAPQLQADIDKLTSEIETYQTNIKSILNGKAPEIKQKTSTTLGKGSLDNL